MKKMFFSFIALVTLCIVTGCGITEELEQAKNNVHTLELIIEEQAENYQTLADYISEIPDAFAADLTIAPTTGLFSEETGAVYENLQLRKDLLSDMTTNDKRLKKAKKDLERISNKKAVDVDNSQLKLITRSLEIVLSNFNSLVIYADTSTLLEEEFYGQLPMDNMSEQLSLVERTQGYMVIVSEEAQANSDYSLSLMKTFNKEAIKSKEKKR